MNNDQDHFYHIYRYDVDSLQVSQLTDYSNQYRARLSGSRLIFEDSRSGHEALYSLDLSR